MGNLKENCMGECDHNEVHCSVYAKASSDKSDCHDDADCRCFDPEG